MRLMTLHGLEESIALLWAMETHDCLAPAYNTDHMLPSLRR